MATIRELYEECKIRGIKGYSKLKKKDLEILLKKRVNTEWKVGIHVSKNGDMNSSIVNAIKELKLNAIQIFTHGPRNQRESEMDYKSVKISTSDVHLYVHSSYITNPWNDKPEIFSHTIDQFKSAQSIGAIGVILHIPKMLPKCVAKMTKTIVSELKKQGINIKVILEMKAVTAGDMSYESPEKINALIDELILLGLSPANTYICIDTAHIYAGKAQIRTYTEGKEYLNKLIYPEWIGLIHLNGNEYDAEKRAGDKHAIPLTNVDKIWAGIKYKDSGCRAFIEWAKEKDIDCILEIKEQHTYKEVKEFIKLIV